MSFDYVLRRIIEGEDSDLCRIRCQIMTEKLHHYPLCDSVVYPNSSEAGKKK